MCCSQEMTQDYGGLELGLGILASSLSSFGIKTKPLNILKKSSNEEKIRGKKPYSQVIEEMGAPCGLRTSHWTPGKVLQNPTEVIMKIISWNV
jgi:hypothetical protein